MFMEAAGSYKSPWIERRVEGAWRAGNWQKLQLAFAADVPN